MAGHKDSHDDMLHRMRHSAAHIMAEAVLQLYPDAKIAIGPAIDTGFYYDFDLGKDEGGRPKTFTPEDLAEIEKRMRQSIAAKKPFQYRQVTADEAKQLFRGQPYKEELTGWRRAGSTRTATKSRVRSPSARTGTASSRTCAAARTWSTRARSRRTRSS